MDVKLIISFIAQEKMFIYCIDLKILVLQQLFPSLFNPGSMVSRFFHSHTGMHLSCETSQINNLKAKLVI